MEFSMEDIYRLPQVTRTHFLECNANGYTANPARRAPGSDGAGNAWTDQLQHVDRGAGLILHGDWWA